MVTHAHPDHIACLAQFQRDLPVYMHPADLPLVHQFNEQRHYGIDPSRLTELHAGFEFDLGGRRLRVYEVPGHSAGSVALLDETTGELFAADAVGNNRPTIVDALWMQMPRMLLLDEYLSSLQAFRAETDGQVKIIYTGHNDRPLAAEPYLDNLEQAVQRLVDQGAKVLVPSLRPVGVWQVIVGDRLTDPNWVSINVDRNRFLTTAPDQIATLSLLQVEGARLAERFHPARLAYTARVDPSVAQVSIVPTATSTRHQALTINGTATPSRRPHSVSLVPGENQFTIAVTSPDGASQSLYTLTITRG